MTLPVLLLSTAPSQEEGERLARALVDERLAACVSVVPGARSFYRWQGAVQSDAEVLLLIKSTEAASSELGRRLRELHSYDVPELLCIQVDGGDSNYLAWLAAEVVGARGGD